MSVRSKIAELLGIRKAGEKTLEIRKRRNKVLVDARMEELIPAEEEKMGSDLLKE